MGKVSKLVDQLFEAKTAWTVTFTNEGNESFSATTLAKDPTDAVYTVGRSKQFINWFKSTWRENYPFNPLKSDRGTPLQYQDGEAMMFWAVRDLLTGSREIEGTEFSVDVQEAEPGVNLSALHPFPMMNREQQEQWEAENLDLDSNPVSLRIPGPRPSLKLPTIRTWMKCPEDIKEMMNPREHAKLFGTDIGMVVATVNDITAILGFSPEDWRFTDYGDEFAQGHGSKWTFLLGDVSEDAIERIRASESNPFEDQTDTQLCSIFDKKSFHTGEVIEGENPQFQFVARGPRSFFKSLFGDHYQFLRTQKEDILTRIMGKKEGEDDGEDYSDYGDFGDPFLL
jgi:hypothetical protein